MKENPLKKIEALGQSILARLYSARSDRQRGASRFDQRGWTARDDLEPIYL